MKSYCVDVRYCHIVIHTAFFARDRSSTNLLETLNME